MSIKQLYYGAASTLTTSTEDMSISSEGADGDVNIVIKTLSKNRQTTKQTGQQQNTSRPRQEAPLEFRRCSLEHAKRYVEARAGSASSSSAPKRGANDINQTTARPRRRSSLKSGPSSITQHVAFSEDVHMKKIEFRDDAYFQATWLSQTGRAEIQEKAKTDMRIVKHLGKNPDLACRPDMRRLRSLISARGMEHLYSRHTMDVLKNEKNSVVCAVLEAQQRLGNSHSSSFSSLDTDTNTCSSGTDVAETIAKICTEKSLPSRRRALRLAAGDEAAVRKYLGRTNLRSRPSPSPSSELSSSLISYAAGEENASHDLFSSSHDDKAQHRQATILLSRSRTSSSFTLNSSEDASGDDSIFFVYP